MLGRQEGDKLQRSQSVDGHGSPSSPPYKNQYSPNNIWLYDIGGLIVRGCSILRGRE